jgi:glycosyltransferase involved in cell wall biosynthesis
LPRIKKEKLDGLGERVKFRGWLTGPPLKQAMAAGEFFVIFRENARWSNACFPTKVPEFMALGVPVICNLTSDMELYLRDGQEALIVPELSAAALAGTLKRAAQLDGTQKAFMSRCARQRAEESFDFRRHAERLGEFVKQVMNGDGGGHSGRPSLKPS